MMQNCLTRRPCTSLSTQFYRTGESDPEYNITITYASHTPPSNNTNPLFSFELRTDAMALMADTCTHNVNLFMTLRTYGPIRLSEVVLYADVVVDTRCQLHMINSRLVFGDILSFPVNFSNKIYASVLQKLKTFIDDQC
uniref:BPI2 domain-containing protein n=1 Tax=Mesocestoides corti TaxID=53468 RepID=A0A5K3FUB1_MESCO